MPRVGDLSKCKIYKIVSLNNPELVYYGHTCQPLSQRFTRHKSKYNKSTSKIIIEKGDAVILLVENFPCESEDKANAREAFYILNNVCVKKNIPGRTKDEYDKIYRESHQEELKIYSDKYRETHKEQSKDYYENNKDILLENSKQYYELHKEQKKDYSKEYHEKNKEEISKKKKEYYMKKKLEKNI